MIWTTEVKGALGEQAAARYLRKGYELISANYKTKFGEIDIIARRTIILYLLS